MSPVTFTALDYAILSDLYRYRALTLQQLKAVHFPQSTSYVYLKMSILKKEELVVTEPLLEKGRKRGAIYFITEKGIRLLARANRISGTPRRARETRPDPNLLPIVLDTNKLYEEMVPHVWKLIDSREWKKRWKMNPNTLVRCGLQFESDRPFGVYILEANPHDTTITTILVEIQQNKPERILLLVKSSELYHSLLQSIKGAPVSELCVLPFHFGIRLLQRYGTRTKQQELYEQIGSVEPISNRYLFGEYRILHEGEEKYLADYLFGNISLKYYILQYSVDRYLQDGKKMLLLLWEHQVEEFREYQAAYPHINFHVLSDDLVM